MSTPPEETPTGDYLADPADLSLRTGIASDDDLLLQVLRRVTARFRADVGHHVTLVEGDVYNASGDGSRRLHLPFKPLVAPITVTIGDDEIPAEDYAVGYRTGMLRHVTGWPDGLENITVACSHGHEATPDDIADAVLEFAEFVLSATAGVESATSGSETVKLANSLVNGGTTDTWAKAVARHSVGFTDRT